MKKLPTEIFVYWTCDEDPCLIAFPTIEEVPTDENGVTVGKYQLLDTGEFKVHVERKLHAVLRKRFARPDR